MKVSLLLSAAATILVLGTIITVSVVFTKPNPQVVQPLVVEAPVFNASRCNELVCSGHGSCIEPTGPLEEVQDYFCICDRWYFGESCNQSCPGLCSQRGDCVSSVNTSNSTAPIYHLHSGNMTVVRANQTNVTSVVLSCECDDPWFGGADCGITCPDLCSHRGNCTLLGTCDCPEGYLGDGCQYQCPGFNCSGQGVCELKRVSATDAYAQCVCDPDWWGPDCSSPRINCTDMEVLIKTSPRMITGSAAECIWSTTNNINYEITVLDAHAGIINFSATNAALVTASGYKLDGFISAVSTLSITIALTNDTGEPASWSFVAQRFPCGLSGACSSCDSTTHLCSCAFSHQTCFCADDTAYYCDFTGQSPSVDHLPPEKDDTTYSPHFVIDEPTRPPRPVDVSTILSSSWKPQLPSANRFPALFGSSVNAPLSQNEAAIIFLAVVYGLYAIGILAILLRNKFQQQPVMMEKPAAAPDNKDKTALRVGLELPQNLSRCQEFVHMFTRRHIVLGICFAGHDDPFPKLARLTFLVVQLLTSLTVSAVWFGRRENAGEFFTSGVLAALVLTPFNELVYLLLRQANRVHLEAFVAYLVCGVVAAWCSYTCVLFSANFGPDRASSWLVSFAISITFQFTFGQLIATLILTIVLAIARQMARPQDNAIELSGFPGQNNTRDTVVARDTVIAQDNAIAQDSAIELAAAPAQ